MLTIYEFKLEVSSPCQNDCELCAHADLMRHIKGYQLSLEKLERFLYYTERSNYFIRSLSIHGPGEPFLWRDLNEGLLMLKRSKAIGWVTMVTNGLLLDRITDEAMACLDRLFISVYANYNRHDVLNAFLAKHGQRVSLWDGTYFWEHTGDPKKTAPATGGCSCVGPMLYDDRIYPYCGPPVFGAAKAKGVDIASVPHLSVPLGPDYMASFNAKLVGRMDICRYCWSNPNFHGQWRTNDTRKTFPNTPPDAIRRIMPAAGQPRPAAAPAIQ
ncbi:MAG TPA: radical SAM protein [Opitutaceae bacterium]|nr:radical SAM protein [Opitutaceae bacterium]